MEWQMLLDYAPQGASSRPALRALPETARDSSRERGYPDVLSAYTANLCPLSGGVEFAGFRENFGETIDEVGRGVLRGGPFGSERRNISMVC